MKVDDYYQAFAEAPNELFQEIASDEELMDYAMQVVEQWLESNMETEAISEEMAEKVYNFLMSLGASMFVQGYAANSLRTRFEIARMFESNDDA